MIQLKQVSKIYELGGEKIHALDRVTLDVDDGDFIAVTGPSGSGKSTLANVIGGLDTPDDGDVFVDGQSLAKANDKALSHYRNKMVGFVFQNFNLQPNYTALENVMVPLVFAKVKLSERKKHATECLKAVGLGDRMNHRPTQLSGGQRQRVCIARALANNPRIIIADEPTGNLDTKKSAEIVDILKHLNKELGVTIIVITHDPNVAVQAKKKLTITDGKVK
ncbi:MAG: ABC transporter ATP-binding protein [Patescibacteria group bacterium]|nr:ABC transporter ATP-binding protein [Patescibacteria group bacterium]MDD5715764.1 ABC transporter ATP-binding protein [Patescibacteria group bacterium]